MFRLGLDVGGTKINIGILDQSFSLIATKRLLIKELSDPIRDIKSAVLDLCKSCSVSYNEILTCGVGVPGTVSADGKTLIKAPNIAVLSEDFAPRLEKELQIPVTMMQDSRAAALGEYLVGAGRGAKTLICITLGTGIGTGLIINGSVYNGALGAAGELGHIPVIENGRPCGCGKKGCLEKYCAGRGLDITASEILGEGASAKDLFAAAKGGRAEAIAAIDQAIVLLGRALIAAINLLSPDKVLFSGGMSEETDAFLYPLISYIKKGCYSSGELPIMEKAALGEYSPLVGAALSYKHK